MQKLWAPWRLRYVQQKIKHKGCVFCLAAKSSKDRENLVVYRNKSSFALLNLFPYANGHIMVAPYRHVKELSQLSRDELLDLLELLNISQARLDKILSPEGYNIGANIGKSAGAGFDKHLHIHIVPRWKGDTNFMPVIFNTKVISQSLKSLYNKLTDANKNRYRKKRR
jgi:ATP adenylyltransferase